MSLAACSAFERARANGVERRGGRDRLRVDADFDQRRLARRGRALERRRELPRLLDRFPVP